QVVQPHSAERVVGYMQQALESLADALEQRPLMPARQIDVLSNDERQFLLSVSRGPSESFPTDLCMHQLFEAQVRQQPQATALICGDTMLSYAQLNDRANQLAHELIARGAKPDTLIALCVERSVGMVVGLFGILKAGAAYLPLDPGNPPDRLAQMLEDARPLALLVDASGLHAVETVVAEQLPLLRVDEAEPSWSSRSPANPDIHATGLTPAHLAYVIYTSGSTGRPKGVPNEHRGLLNRLSWMQASYRLQSNDLTLQKTPYSFDVSVWEFFWTLGYGAALLMAPPGAHKDPLALLELIQAHEVTTLHFVPSMLASFLDQVAPGSCRSLRHIFCSGEALSPALARKARQWFPHAALHNLYGPTEAAIDVTAWACPPGFSGDVVPIGKPIANVSMYLLDAQLQPVPFGAVGELYIGGAGVARGYLNRPELTAERFLTDPFASTPGAHMYRTGDLARYMPDGEIEYLGRNDHQVKIRGFRIELGEIEAVLAAQPGVAQAVVVARDAAAGHKQLVAYVAAVEGVRPDSTALRQAVAAALPDYMLPAAFVTLDTLPLTPSGKIDRKALPAPDEEAFMRRAYEAPRGEIEQRLAQVWSELLGIERIGRHDNFFELGGHSLLAIQLMGRLRRLGLSIEVHALFATPTLADLADTLGSHHEWVTPPNLIEADSTTLSPAMLPLIDLSQADIDQIVARVPGGVRNIKDIYALSPLQEGILFHHLLAKGGDPYLQVNQLAFDDRAVLDRYLGALQQVIDRHDILRTAFIWEGVSMPAQVVWRQAQLDVTEVTLDPQAGAPSEQLARRFDPRHYRIDLTHAPLLRAAIAREPGSDRWLLLQIQHHLIDDVSSLGIILAEIKAIAQGRGDRLPAPQPFRHMVAQSRLGVSTQEHEQFFRQMLADVQEPTLPFGLADVHRDGSQVQDAYRLVPASLQERLRAQARRCGVSLASLCHLAWGQVVARTSGREDVVFGTVLFGRMQAGKDAGRAIGLFINTLPLRLTLDGRSVEDGVRQAHAQLAQLLRHEHASLALAQRCSGVAAPAPLFSALLNYRHNLSPSGETATMPLLDGVTWISGEERSNYPFTLSVDDSGHALGLTVQVVQPHSAERVVGYMQQALESLADALEQRPLMPARQIDVLSNNELTQLLSHWNATSQDIAALPFPTLFEQQALHQPQALAIGYEGTSLSYGELEQRANRLAHVLIAEGIGPEQIVGLAMPRSPELIVALLG
ncbi:amino acid adenylation domain-containing protein, partial [Dyella sp.]|uniref:amino acid adenylation domain-containing protein n=1 Tax=Dyella sp. TaxID=1869338 RepID=UPI002ED1B48F